MLNQHWQVFFLWSSLPSDTHNVPLQAGDLAILALLCETPCTSCCIHHSYTTGIGWCATAASQVFMDHEQTFRLFVGNLHTKWSLTVHPSASDLALTDSYCRLVLDMLFCGSIVSTIAFQTVINSIVLVTSSFNLIVGLPQVRIVMSPIQGVLVIPSSAFLAISTTRAWCYGPKYTWKLGVKELAQNGTSCHLNPKLSLLGTRRAPGDDMRTIWVSTFWFPMRAFLHLVCMMPSMLKLAFTWRTT
jgi:hypothetical protein